MIKARGIKILKKIINSENEIRVEDLSKEFGVSSRMIRYDIDDINYYLKSKGITEIDKKPNSPIRIGKDVEKIEKVIKNFDIETYVLSNNERVGLIIYELLSSKEGCKYKTLEEILNVSRTTVVADLKKATKWLLEQEIEVIREKNILFLKGKEKNIRNIFRAVLIGNTKYNILNIIEKIYTDENKSIVARVNGFNISEKNIEYIKETIKVYEEEIGECTHEAFMNIVISIFIIINRIDFVNEDEYEEYKSIENENRKEYKIAYEILKNLEKRFNITMSKGNINYLASRILSVSKGDQEILNLKNRYEAIQIADEIIEGFKEKYKKTFLMEKDLYNSFVNHINGMIFRIKYGVKIENILLNNIISNYKEIFDLVQTIIEQLEFEIGRFKYDEIGYIVLYVVAAIEKIEVKEIDNIKNILIICSGGFATSRLLETKIKERYYVNVKGISGIHGINKYLEKYNIDIIISTIKIDRSKINKKIPIVEIKNIFDENEILKLNKYLDYNNKIVKEEEISIEEVVALIKRTCYIKEEEKLKIGLEKILCVKKTSNKEYILEESINLNQGADTFEEAIKISAMPLLRQGIIKEKYIESMIETVYKYGAYIVVDEGIAIPHAKADGNVMGNGISITTFNKPIKILKTEGIKLFITIAINDKKKHIEIMNKILKIIENEKLIEYILSSNDSKKVYEEIVKWI